SPSLKYYAQRLKPRRATQLVARLARPYDADGVRVTDPVRYFAEDIPWRAEATGAQFFPG
ncbi:hypothetical protein KJ612_12815, partial [Myxococcota bacterium]|nr:hypothetical protein [Myxococcota bacterium]MBU1411794.1 hypothetical protein [Myxococcota bacterium]